MISLHFNNEHYDRFRGPVTKKEHTWQKRNKIETHKADSHCKTKLRLKLIV